MMTSNILDSVWLLLLFKSAFTADTEIRHNLTFMLVTSFGGLGRYNSSGTLPAAEIALKEINSHTDILSGYNLVYDEIRDSRCDRQASLNAFFDGILSDPGKIGVIGCGCSVASEPVAEIIHNWNIPLIAYGTTSASLSNITVFKNFFRANPPSTTLTPTLRALMKEFEWKRVGLLTQDENRFRRVEDSIRELLQPEDIDVESRKYPTGGDPRSVQDIFLESEDYRVFVLNSYPNPRIICEIFKGDFLHPKYTWIAYGWYAQASWTNGEIVNCTNDQLRRVLENGISVEVFPIPEDMDAETISGLSPRQFQEQYEALAVKEDYEILDTTAAQLYDDVWGLALALNDTLSMVDLGDISGTGCENLPGDLLPLEDFTYDNKKLGCLITWNLRKVNFLGVSGRVHFDENLINHTATLLQYELSGNILTRRRFATVDRDNNFTFKYEDGFTSHELYPGGIPPDGKPQSVLHKLLFPIIIVVDMLAFVGILFAVVCLLFNILYRERKIVKLTSPKLNYLIIAGTITMYMSIFFYLIPTTSPSIAQLSCLVREWLFTIGYTLAYGAMLAKLWRVYKIFHNPAPNKRIFKDWHLMLFTVIVTGIALILLLLGTAIPQLRGVVTETIDPERPDGITNQGVIIDYSVLVCHQEVGASLYWRIFIHAYLAVLQILGIMLAFQTRRVKMKSLRDSTFVTANVYISSIVIVVFILITFVLRSYLNAYSALFAIGIFILTTTFLVLTFVPKMIILYKDPTGEGLQDTMIGTINKDNRRSRLETNQEAADPTKLIQKIAFLESKLTQSEHTVDRMRREVADLTQNSKTLVNE